MSLLLLIGPQLLAQDVKWGPTRKGDSRITLREIVSHHADQTVVIASKGRGFLNWNSDPIFERLDAGFASTMITKLKPEFAGNELAIEFCFESNGQIYLFGSSTDRKLGKRELYYQAVDAQKLALNGTPTKVAELSFVRETKAPRQFWVYILPRQQLYRDLRQHRIAQKRA